MKYFLGVDPGLEGAFVILNESSQIVEKIGMPLIGNEYNKTEMKEILLGREYVHIGLENPQHMFGGSKKSAVSLAGCVRLIEGMLFALELSHTLVRPKEWQKEMWKHIKIQYKVSTSGKTKVVDTKATSSLSVINIWPKEDFYLTNKGNKSKNMNDGLVDAVLICEYVRRIYGK